MSTTYGQRLLEAFKHAKKERPKLTRKDLAAAVKISVQAVGDAMNGKTKALTAENNAYAARFLGVSSYWLATGEGAMVPAPTRPKGAVFEELSSDEREMLFYWRRMSVTDRKKMMPTIVEKAHEHQTNIQAEQERLESEGVKLPFQLASPVSSAAAKTDTARLTVEPKRERERQ